MLTLRLITSLLYDHSDKEQEIRRETEFARAPQQFNDSLIPVSRSLAFVGWIIRATIAKIHVNCHFVQNITCTRQFWFAWTVLVCFCCLFCVYFECFCVDFCAFYSKHVRCCDVTVTSLAFAKILGFCEERPKCLDESKVIPNR